MHPFPPLTDVDIYSKAPCVRSIWTAKDFEREGHKNTKLTQMYKSKIVTHMLTNPRNVECKLWGNQTRAAAWHSYISWQNTQPVLREMLACTAKERWQTPEMASLLFHLCLQRIPNTSSLIHLPLRVTIASLCSSRPLLHQSRPANYVKASCW